MSFFKNLKNMVTGGSATLSISATEPGLEKTFPIRIEARIGDDACQVNRVYFRIVGEETVQVPDIDVARRNGNATTVSRETVRATTVTTDFAHDVAGALTLDANETYAWEVDVTLPPEALPTYTGALAQHRWKIIAGLDMTGNDPDSGWETIEVY